MTEKFLIKNEISVQRLLQLPSWGELSGIKVDFEINPEVTRGASRGGFPDATLTITRSFFDDDNFDYRVEFASGGSASSFGGVTALELVTKLRGKRFAVPGEIKYKGE